jgi:hypothetical protein
MSASSRRISARPSRPHFANWRPPNPDLLAGIFGDSPWTNRERLPDATLKNLIEHLSTQTLSVANVPEDELGNAYEFLIKKSADDSGHTAAEFYTNRTVVHLMTQLLAPTAGESIYDPTCGTGGMLISALVEVKRSGGEYRTLKLYGQERNLITSGIARMNLFLHGVEDFQIIRGDTLADPRHIEGDGLRKFDEADGVLNQGHNIIALVDEAHRTQEGDLGRKMRDALPNAFLFGLTGTPINRVDRNTFYAFGADEDDKGYLSRYGFEASIRDGATLKLHFEPRLLELHIDKAAIDAAFKEMTGGLSDLDRDSLGKTAAKMAVLVKTPERIRRVCEDIVQHFQSKVEPNGFKARSSPSTASRACSTRPNSTGCCRQRLRQWS